MIKKMVMLMMITIFTLILVMSLTVVMVRAKLITNTAGNDSDNNADDVPNDDGGGDTNEYDRYGDDINDVAD